MLSHTVSSSTIVNIKSTFWQDDNQTTVKFTSPLIPYEALFIKCGGVHYQRGCSYFKVESWNWVESAGKRFQKKRFISLPEVKNVLALRAHDGGPFPRVH